MTRRLTLAVAKCLVPTVLGASGMAVAQDPANPGHAEATAKKAFRRGALPGVRPELRLSRELGIAGGGDKVISDTLPELPAGELAAQSTPPLQERIPLPAGDLNRGGITPASRARVHDGSLILEADDIGKEGDR